MTNSTVLLVSLLGMFAYGLWAVLATIATRAMTPELTVVLSYGTATVIVLAYVLATGSPALDREGLLYALGSGAFLSVGAMSYYYGLKFGDAAIASTITGLFFVVAALVGILFLGDTIDATDAAGFAFAVCAVVLIAW
ncbi:EamA family transporter [Halorientalis halophila]|uniref:EamA family transporter n=1 Tax=Halorientalis halophila TaxID=3108499 RepID=UPI00300983AB